MYTVGIVDMYISKTFGYTSGLVYGYTIGRYSAVVLFYYGIAGKCY